jgi:SAM-dependent methyltransferase
MKSMPVLTVHPELFLPKPTREFLPRLVMEVDPGDKMYSGHDRHYLSSGASALNVILAAQNLATMETFGRILDFGSGAGRVTRWLRAAYPSADIHTTDVRVQDLDFCTRALQTTSWPSGIEIDKLRAPATYDLIWVGSVMTHLSARDWMRLVSKLLSWLTPGGLLVFSVHGRLVAARDGTAYIDAAAWKRIMKDHAKAGYGYADYADQRGYGVSVESLSWTAKTIESIPAARLVLLSERCWDDHHDVVALQAG